jgi:hypothetical protein
MKILFSNPPWWQGAPPELRHGTRAGSRWPFTHQAFHLPDQFRFGGYIPFPYFMGYAASYTQREFPEASVSFRDSIARGEGYGTYFAHVRDIAPDWIVIETATPSWDHDQRILTLLETQAPQAKVILAGTLDVKKANEILDAHKNVAAIVRGEYDKQVAKVIRNGAERQILDHDLLTVAEMNWAPAPMFDEQCALNYWDACPEGQLAPQLQVLTSRGCPYKCISGDTPVNTVHGMIPIRELAKRFSEVGVFTYDPKERRAKVSTAKAIRKYGDAEKLVRVTFDDGTHIDCTPDHRFLAFKWGNQHVGEREWECQAADLKPGAHVRAFNVSPDAAGYPIGAWTRKGRVALHRMVAEWTIGRPLAETECVHHKDHDKTNFAPSNLEVCDSAAEHFARHPEVSERMRKNNPAGAGLSAQWVERIAAANRGKVRSAESRERYRLAAIKREARKSPEQKRADVERMANGQTRAKSWLNRSRDTSGRFEPANLVNHRVLSVTELPGLHATYCLTVPETAWFYANNVLVANCSFCVWPATMTGNDPDGMSRRTVRHYSAEYMEAFLTYRIAVAKKAGTPIRSIYLDDDTFNLGDRHTLAMCAVMKKIGLPWSAMCRADTVKRETWQVMKDSGCFGVKIGFESGSQYVIDHIVNKNLDLKKAEETAKYLRSIGLTVHGTFTVGLPGETQEQAQETRDFIARLRREGTLNTHQLSGTAEIEGTPLHTLRERGHLDKYPGAKLDGNYTASPDGQKKIEEMAAK